MSTYSEHVKNAQHEIDGVWDWQEREGDTEATGLASALVAQDQATLAHAEQQRIANLISLWQGGHGGMLGVEGEAQDALTVDDNSSSSSFSLRLTLRPDIADALGIGGEA